MRSVSLLERQTFRILDLLGHTLGVLGRLFARLIGFTAADRNIDQVHLGLVKFAKPQCIKQLRNIRICVGLPKQLAPLAETVPVSR